MQAPSASSNPNAIWITLREILRALVTPKVYENAPIALFAQIRVFNAIILLVIAVLLCFLLPFNLLTAMSSYATQRYAISSGVLITSIVCYVLVRRGMYRVAVYLFFLAIGTLLFAFALGASEQGKNALYYLVFMLGWSALFVKWRDWITLIALDIFAILLYTLVMPDNLVEDILRGAFLFHIISIFTFVGTRYYTEQARRWHLSRIAINEARLRMTIEATSEGYYLLEAVYGHNKVIVDFKIVEINTEACNQMNMTREQLLGGLICELFPVNKTGGFFEQYKEAVISGEGFNQEYYIPTGHIGAGWYYHQVVPVMNGLVIINRNITQSKHFELEMIRKQNRLQSLVESQSAYLVRTDNEGNYTYANPRFLEQFGYDIDKLIGKNSLEGIAPEDHEKTMQATLDCIANAGHPVSVTLQKISRDGKIIWTDWEFVAITDNLGNISEIQCVGLDASSRMNAERNRMDAEQLRLELLQQEELNQIKTRMMTRISHEFRTPLSIIRSSTNLLERFGDRMDDDKRAEKLRHINEEIDRLASMVTDMGRILHGQTALQLMLNESDVTEIVGKTVKLYNEDKTNLHPIQYTVQENFPKVRVDEHMMDIIVTNLVSNAVKFSPPKSPVTISLTYTARDFSLAVGDRGVGVLPSELTYIYDPFFRGSNFGEVGGMGLGLSLVKNAVDAHNGIIEVDSLPGQGTTMKVTIPIKGIS